MKPAWLLALLLGLATAVPAGRARADEPPLAAGRQAETDSWSALGPFLFSKSEPDGGRSKGFRPFYVQRTDARGETSETTVLYPLFYYRRYGVVYEWSVFKLINRVGRVEGAPPDEQAQVPTSERNFSIWPFYVSRRSPYPGSSYHGLFPIYGDIRDFLGYDRLSWTLFPIYARGERRGAVTTYVVWPVFRFIGGADEGFAVWPIYGHHGKPNGESRNFFLWPLGWNNTLAPKPDSPPGTPPTREVGLLPLYSGTHGPTSVNVTYLWPFFGYSDRTEPDHYHETRYFWPFFLQGHGDHGHFVDRWGPFYSHSVNKGVESLWILWPFWHRQWWDEGKVAEIKTRFFYFFYSSLEQHSLARPNAAPASKHQLWPIMSAWDNGAGRKQFEVLSPVEPLFADNPEMREAWSPLFAVVRHEQTAPGQTRTSLLWNTVVVNRSADGNRHVSWFDFKTSGGSISPSPSSVSPSPASVSPSPDSNSPSPNSNSR